MNAASAIKSARLQRVLKVLSDGKEHSSLDLVRRAKAIAPGTCVSELRENGALIECTRRNGPNGPVWYYKMTKGPRQNG
ncbi:hypothetical protein CDO87_14275 [Sagittula sp. P11]|uniref:hypothetical protein n=1 Tax=Sagittula sp. P11 TaxID=2009329 RepID=UPI000C2D31DA|nr:hypothetical protein [Sagittula sp. P11]AUC54271.1 hypothetical protein CDO87_14275 [Sagittula sp. P11]